MVKKLLPLIFCFSFVQFYAQNESIFCKQLNALQTLIAKSHYSPKPVNDSLSKAVFELFLDQLDEDKRYFTQGDVDSFKQDIYNLDDYLIANTCDFIDKYATALKKRVEISKRIVESLKNQPLDYTGSDTLYFKPPKERNYLKNESHAERYWNKRIRFLIISKLIEEDSIIDNVRKNFKVMEASIKPKVIQNQLCMLDEFLNQKGALDTFVSETFLNALLNYEDPNSTFFNDSERTEFESGLANSQMSFGLVTTKNNEGEIVIAHVIPGSSAFKNGNIEENDVILSLSSKGNVLETYCISNEDILAFINDGAHETVVFKIKKTNGDVEVIQLSKAVTKVEENSVRGFILSNEAEFGYIQISNFYTDIESPGGLGLANDVAKELYKLNQENIQGLVIDLRFNGGGSMKEAAELSGMFIDRGPLSIIKYSNGETYTVRDMNRGTIFTKPIVVLINNYSASASEFFASVMQDYSRAIIVGSPSHGKSSAQVILPLSETEDLGFTKLTVEKFYRITGLSHQSVGVIPDVTLPSIYDNFENSERFEKFALINDSVATTMKYHPFKAMPLELIAANSFKRTEHDASFKAIKDINTIVVNEYINKNSEYPLTFDNIYQDINTYNSLWSNFYSLMDAQTTDISARNTAATEEILQYNQDDKSANELILENIANDIYIEESITILLDLLNPKNN